MSLKIGLFVLILLLVAILGSVSVACAQNSIGTSSPSWCAIPSVTVPTTTDLMPNICIGGPKSSSLTSWKISIWSFFSTDPADTWGGW